MIQKVLHALLQISLVLGCMAHISSQVEHNTTIKRPVW
jgi:hypothetical protein